MESKEVEIDDLLKGLSKEQQHVIHLAQDGKDIFFTGPAGTGKSRVLAQLQTLFKRMGKKAVFTAPTGVAALNIPCGCGVTLHKFSKFSVATTGARNKDIPCLYRKHVRDTLSRQHHDVTDEDYFMENSPFTHAKLDVLVIDEISMVDPFYLDLMSFTSRQVRKEQSLPWGGLQVIMCGDFYQLPPVIKEHLKHLRYEYTFQSRTWNWMLTSRDPRYPGFERVELVKNFRQQNDLPFVILLNCIRQGECPPQEIIAMLQSNHVSLADGDVTYLCRENAVIDRRNQQVFNAIISRHEEKYMCNDWKDADATKTQLDKAIQSMRFGKEISLKIGSRVMLLVNGLSRGLANGSCGKVIGFDNMHLSEQDDDRNYRKLGPPFEYPEQHLPIVKFDSGEEIIVPFYRQAFAIMESVEVEDELLLSGKRNELREREIYARTQIPLKHAWAMTIHKAQGLTLPGKVIIDFSTDRRSNPSPGHGLVYVAMSRATSMQNIRLEHFCPAYINVSQSVVNFHRCGHQALQMDITPSHVEPTCHGFLLQSQDGTTCAEYHWVVPRSVVEAGLPNAEEQDVNVFADNDTIRENPVAFISATHNKPSFIGNVSADGRTYMWKLVLPAFVIRHIIETQLGGQPASKRQRT